MLLIKQTGPHCLVTSAAMLLNTTPELIHWYIGHDGTRIQWPPDKMIGVHIQEIMDVCFTHGCVLFPYQLEPCSAPDTDTTPVSIGSSRYTWGRFISIIEARPGILIMPNHAVAWDGHKVFDPKGWIGEIKDYPEIFEAWLLVTL